MDGIYFSYIIINLREEECDQYDNDEDGLFNNKFDMGNSCVFIQVTRINIDKYILIPALFELISVCV